ncbi:hypothetical protein OSB04_019462 [Centaurea solstitialis]|uniref:Uncharacterized protein n=1 Tax=Centaurea solstitialis TaxID=347529 RepID=A0AA38WEA8_9ASTR|nr:hypothetical protein OSB04_019462 [Centaurea solstitialis]
MLLRRHLATVMVGGGGGVALVHRRCAACRCCCRCLPRRLRTSVVVGFGIAGESRLGRWPSASADGERRGCCCCYGSGDAAAGVRRLFAVAFARRRRPATGRPVSQPDPGCWLLLVAGGHLLSAVVGGGRLLLFGSGAPQRSGSRWNRVGPWAPAIASLFPVVRTIPGLTYTIFPIRFFSKPTAIETPKNPTDHTATTSTPSRSCLSPPNSPLAPSNSHQAQLHPAQAIPSSQAQTVPTEPDHTVNPFSSENDSSPNITVPPPPIINSNPIPTDTSTSTHSMTTRSKAGIFKPKHMANLASLTTLLSTLP